MSSRCGLVERQMLQVPVLSRKRRTVPAVHLAAVLDLCIYNRSWTFGRFLIASEFPGLSSWLVAAPRRVCILNLQLVTGVGRCQSPVASHYEQ